jgi:hypothetical protein
VAITAGLDPELVEIACLFSDHLEKFVFQRTREVSEPILRKWGNYHHITPKEFLLWIQQYQIDFPKELEELIMKNANIVDWKAAHDELRIQYDTLKTQHKNFIAKTGESLKEEKLNPKERKSLLKLVLGMAIDAYGYNPKASRNPTAEEISGHLKTRGISIDADTVRKWLNEGKESVEIETEIDA